MRIIFFWILVTFEILSNILIPVLALFVFQLLFSSFSGEWIFWQNSYHACSWIVLYHELEVNHFLNLFILEYCFIDRWDADVIRPLSKCSHPIDDCSFIICISPKVYCSKSFIFDLNYIIIIWWYICQYYYFYVEGGI